MTDPLIPLGAQRPLLDAHRLALQILAEKRFAERVTRPAPHTWWDALWSWVRDRLRDLTDAFSRSVHVSDKAAVALGDVLLTLVAIVVVVAGARLLMQLNREYESGAGGQPLDTRMPAQALYARALTAAQEGRYDEAIALLFRATLASLDVRHAIDDVPSHTVNECRLQVRARAPRFAAAFDGIAGPFTAVAYANAPATAHEWARAREAYDQTFARPGDET